MLANLAGRLGLKTTPKVYMVDGIAQPFVWGWVRGSIYLPEELVRATPQEHQRTILAHELAHVARWDAAVNLVQVLVQAVFFFHPLVWWMNRQVRREREKCCDEIVIAGLDANPKQYGKAIVDALVAEYETSQSLPSLAIAGRLKNVEERIEAILSPRRKFYRRPSWPTVAAVVCLGVCAIPTTFVLTVYGKSPQSDQEKEGSPQADSASQPWRKGQVLDFRVINARTKEPLPGVKLELQYHGKGINFQDVKIQTTDAQGRSEIRLPDLRPDAVRVYPSKAGFVPLRVYWGDDLPSPALPKAVTVPLEPGTVWGGVIKNETGEPIPDVKITVHYWESPVGNRQPHLRANIDEETTTDKVGRWRINVMPTEVVEDAPRIFLAHPDYVSDNLRRGMRPMPATKRPSVEDLRAQTAVMVMRKGGVIRGRVTDEKGRPIAGVHLYNEDYYWFDSRKPAATTGEDGRFRIANASFASSGMNDPPPRTMRAVMSRHVAITVQAPGYTPELIHADPIGSTSPLEITLKPGQAVQGQVIDESGKPVEGVSVSVSNWLGYRSRLNVATKTDADGKFHLTDIPLSGALYDFIKSGYMMVYDFPMSPEPTGKSGNEGYAITLQTPLLVAGSIVDAETKQPLARCAAISGVEYDDGRAPKWQRVVGTKTITDGRYEFEFAQKIFCGRVRVEAEGYMPAISRVFRPGGSDKGLVTCDFQLHKAPPLRGIVLGQGEKPLANAEVYLATNLLIVTDRKASSQTLMNARMARTDAAGQFELPPEVEPFYLVVLDGQGYAVTSEKQFADSNQIHIKPWTAEDRSFRAERRPSTLPGKPPVANAKNALTVRVVDVDGKPVEGAHVATYAGFHASPNNFAPYESGWSYSPNILSDNDGMARIANPYIRCVVARHIERKLVGVRSITPEQTKGTDVITLTMHPQCTVSGKLTSKELEARNRKPGFSNVYVCLDDGMGRPMSCMSDNYHFYLPPGTFTLEAYATDTQHVRKTITVKPGQEKLEVEPIDLPPTGLVLLEGKPAPELRDIAAWKNSGPLKLADLRGKVVILVFMPDELMWDETLTNLLAAYEQHHQQGLEVIEIRINYRDTLDSQAKIDAHMARIKNPVWSGREIPIPIALVIQNLRSAKPDAKSKRSFVPMSDYGITGTPTAVLIDRQSRVSGRLEFRSNFDEALLKKVLGQE